MESKHDKIDRRVLSARVVAAEVLQSLDFTRHDTSARLERWMGRTDQRARATDLVNGVIRNLSAIDLVLSQAAKIRMEHTDKKILALLRTGTYELIYVPRTPEYAIVNETVEIAGRLSRKAGGLLMPFCATFSGRLSYGRWRWLDSRRERCCRWRRRRVACLKRIYCLNPGRI
jgi:transcription termination factor NusB